MSEAGLSQRGTPRWVTIVLIMCVGAGIAVLVLFRVNWHFYSIPSVAMEPTLRVGDYLVARLGRYTADDIERGDVIIFRHGDTDWVKRVVGTGGDAVRMIDGAVHLNGMALTTEKAGEYELADPGGHLQTVRQLRETLDGRIYETLDIMQDGPGDNTRLFNVPRGHVFVLGDNRDNSNDSRFGAGMVPVERIVGIAHSILWSPRRETSIGPIKVR